MGGKIKYGRPRKEAGEKEGSPRGTRVGKEAASYASDIGLRGRNVCLDGGEGRRKERGLEGEVSSSGFSSPEHRREAIC